MDSLVNVDWVYFIKLPGLYCGFATEISPCVEPYIILQHIDNIEIYCIDARTLSNKEIFKHNMFVINANCINSRVTVVCYSSFVGVLKCLFASLTIEITLLMLFKQIQMKCINNEFCFIPLTLILFIQGASLEIIPKVLHIHTIFNTFRKIWIIVSFS